MTGRSNSTPDVFKMFANLTKEQISGRKLGFNLYVGFKKQMFL